MSISLIKTGPQQLWKISDHIDGKDYTLPLIVTPCIYSGRNVMHVVSGITLSDAKRRFLKARLDAVSQREGSSEWIMAPTRLESVAFKCPPEMFPEEVLSWPDDNPPNSEVDTLDTQFVRYFCNASGITDLEQGKLLYAAMCHAATRWMLEENKPLNLGFATITAVPYRANWQAILHAAYPDSMRALKFSKPEERDVALDALRMREAFWSEDLIACNDDGTFNWSLAIHPSREFLLTAAAGEFACMSEANPKGAYVSRWKSLVKKLYEHIIASYHSFLAQASLPLARLDESLSADRLRLVPRVTRGRVRSAPPPPPQPHYQVDSDPKTNIYQAASKPAQEEIEDLSDVPDGHLSLKITKHRSRNMRSNR